MALVYLLIYSSKKTPDNQLFCKIWFCNWFNYTKIFTSCRAKVLKYLCQLVFWCSQGKTRFTIKIQKYSGISSDDQIEIKKKISEDNADCE